MNRAGPDLDDLAARLRGQGLDGARVLSRGNQGILVRWTFGEEELVVKTPAGSGLAWKARQSTLLREYRAYRRLEGIPGFPRCYGLIDRRWLVLEYVEGVAFRDARLEDREAFFTELLAIVQAMHQRGVAHGDLKRKSNLLVDRNGHPVILDLGASVIEKPGWRPVNRALFRFVRQTDLNAWIKLKYGSYGGVKVQDLPLLKRSRVERILTRMRRS